MSLAEAKASRSEASAPSALVELHRAASTSSAERHGISSIGFGIIGTGEPVQPVCMTG